MFLPADFQSPSARSLKISGGRPPGGFALVVALTLMSFLLLLALSLFALVQVEIKSSSLQVAQFQARENARLGLLVALGELQQAAGPDQRVTARGDILDSAGTLNDGRRFWTGVWESADPGLGARPGSTAHAKPGHGDLRAWLISVSDPSGEPLAADLDLQGPNPVESSWGRIAMVGSDTAVEEGAVEAGMVAIQNNTDAPTGAYAWWVGDEGIKAKVNVVDPYSGEETGSTDWFQRMRMAQRYGIEAMDFGQAEVGRREVFDAGAARLGSLVDLALAFEDGGEFTRERYHDLTAHSHGLLVDVTTGRLRQDLTHAFEHDTVFDHYYSIQGGAQSRALAFREDGELHNFLNNYGTLYLPNMGILRGYYHMSREIDATEPIFPIGPKRGDEALSSARNHAGQRMDSLGDGPYEIGYHENSPVTPLDARIQISLSVSFTDFRATNEQTPSSHEEQTEDGDLRQFQNIQLQVTPTLLIYNPYNIPLKLTDQSLAQNLLNPLIQVQVGDRQTVSFNLFEILPPNWRADTLPLPTDYRQRLVQTFMLGTRLPEDQVIFPGETLIFSLDESGYLMRGDANHGLDGWRAVFENRWSWPNIRRRATLGTVNDTTIGESFWLPLNAHYIPWALNEGPDGEDITVGDRRTYGQLFEGSGPHRRRSFGFTEAERDRLRLSRVVDPDTNAVLEYEQSLRIRVLFINFPGRHSFRVDTEDGTARSQRFNRARGLTYQGLENPGDVGWLEFGEYIQAAAQPSIATWRHGFRVITEPTEPARFVDANFRAPTVQPNWEGDRLNNPGTDLSSALPFGTYGHPKGRVPGNEWEMPGQFDGSRYQAYWGDSIDGTSDVTNVVLFDIPRDPPVSLGSFQHANVGRYSFHPLYIIGQSYLPPLAEPDRAWRNLNIELDPEEPGGSPENKDVPALDLPYILNAELWDRYFLSGIPQDLTDEGLRELLEGTDQLPNHRLRIVPRDSTTARQLTEPQIPDNPFVNPHTVPVTFNTVGSHLLVNGAFNINSTSVEAWKALLSSTRDLELPVHDPRTGTVSNESGEGALFARFSRTYGDDTNIYTGARRLSRQQVSDLAIAIVEQVKTRGPFGSLADFINRSLDEASDPEHQLSGVLQAAIDSVPSINQRASEASGTDPLETYGSEYGSTPHGPQAAGLPGYLLQSDLLQVLGPVLTARSDTFAIRAYGDIHSPLTGEVEARAWCEAIVQRIPNPVDASSDWTLEQKDTETISPTNKHGRQFQIVSFRWLDPEEI